MKIVFLSNYFNHHQKPFSDAMVTLIGEDYIFIANRRRILGNCFRYIWLWMLWVGSFLVGGRRLTLHVNKLPIFCVGLII